jgi:hypothetical protein
MRALAPLALCCSSLLVAQAVRTPAEFAPGRVSTPHHACLAFAPDGKTVYFRTIDSEPARLMYSRLQDGAWTPAQPLVFPGALASRLSYGDAALAPDGSRIAFVSWPTALDPQRIWSATKQGDGWSEPVPAIDGLWGPSLASDGTLYFGAKRPDSRGGYDLYRARLVNGAYTAPENLGDAVNSAEDEYDSYIAPDQSFLIFTSWRPGGLGKSDFYVSFQREGRWTAARHLGPLVNSSAEDICPVVSPGGRSFFFTSNREKRWAIYQVDLDAIDPFR